ncbi:MAG TPA: 3'-5' exoribonuclease YhaM [Bacillales bacterium]|nr:3'-5' exoribonuclease YhaM [Bacillales bacterium]
MDKGIHQFEIGETVEKFMLIRSAKKAVASNGKPFLTLMLQDRTGEIEAKLWDCSGDDEKAYVAEKIVKVTAEMTSFRGKSQLRLKTLRLAASEDGVKIGDFLKSAPLTIEEMGDEITRYIFEMKNPKLQRLTRQLVKNHQEAFFTYPAAMRNHHEYISGLAYHVVSMLKLAKAIAQLYPSLNSDLLYAGVIVHDLGKVKELSGTISASYTFEGKLLGHIPIMIGEIGDTARELGIEGEEVTLLQHMVLSHHGKAEWGSPKAPLIKEAEVLHMIDNLDARMNMMDRALEITEPGAFTERIQPLDYRSFYKPSLPETTGGEDG